MSQLDQSSEQRLPDGATPDAMPRRDAPPGDRASPARGAADDAVSEDEVRRRAYDRYLARGGSEGSAMDDWLAAERELRERGAGMDEGTSEGMSERADDGPNGGGSAPRTPRVRRDRPMRGERAD